MNRRNVPITHLLCDVDAAKGLFAQRDQKSSVSLKALCLDELLAADFPPRTMLMAPWLAEGGLAMIYAPRDVGKTFLAPAIAYAVACGRSVLGWKAPEPQRALQIDGEPAGVLQERLRRIVESNGAQVPAPDYLLILASDTHPNGLPYLATREGQAQFNALLGTSS